MALLTLLVQIAVILFTARAIGWLFRRIQQPQVMGEMVAGILLGPSLLGWLAPGVSASLFPPESLGALHALSQIGLLLFMFLVGLELDPALLRGRGRVALTTSHASIVLPFLLGAMLALYLYPRYSDASVPFAQFALFMGAAMSITAFPVLARILNERNLLSTKVGAVTIACAAVDDVTAWCILAGVVALVRTGAVGGELFVTLASSALYVAAMIWGARVALRKLEAYYARRGRITQNMVALVLLLMLASAWTTEWLGIHALFGAFLIGAVMPKEPGFVHDLSEKLEDLTVVLLLPLFFAYTGLRTRVGMLDEPALWLDCTLVVLVAIGGKLGGSAAAARLSGLSWRESGALGILMNTRGLMELVILTIGLDLGVISPVVFVMMVLMALVTTFMTTPLLELVYPLRLIRQEALGTDEVARDEAVLIPVALPSFGPDLLAAARAILPEDGARFYALHLLRSEDRSIADTTEVRPYEQEALAPLLAAAAVAGTQVRPLTFVSRDFGSDIAEVARAKRARFILLGWHKPVLGENALGGPVSDVMTLADADVIAYVARRPASWTRVLVPFADGRHDRAALELAARLTASAQVTVLYVIEPDDGSDEGATSAREALAAIGNGRLELKVVESDEPQAAMIAEARSGYDLVVIGASEEWGLEPRLFGSRHEDLAESTSASLMIVRRGDAM